jgi:malate synthase
MLNRVSVGDLSVSDVLYKFVCEEALVGTNVEPFEFWEGFGSLVHDLAPKSRALIIQRQNLQNQINAWHKARKSKSVDMVEYKSFLSEIGYLVPEGPDFLIGTDNVDNEIAHIAGPQLVVPVTNARYALNAVNARWGSLYDSLYGTDALSEADGCERSGPFNPKRGEAVISWSNQFLDEIFPLERGTHSKATAYKILNGALVISMGAKETGLKKPSQFFGFQGQIQTPSVVLLGNHGLYIEIHFDTNTLLGEIHAAGISDLMLEAALTTIIDCEDSVAAVDAEEKVQTYRNWLGLMIGDLSADIFKDGENFTRTLNEDRIYKTVDGGEIRLHGRSLMLVRNVGHLMDSDSILDRNGAAVPEGLIDAMITSLIALHDLNKIEGLRNSRTGSVYIVKPKMHGPHEVAFADELFSRVEDVLGMARNTLKMGIMDEERLTTVNLKECIRVAKNRVAFINTGFLDRTGDEIHTSMEAGPFVRKGDLKGMPWISAYEDWNVDIGLKCGLQGRGQIGKGMWAMPDLMSDMLFQKRAHPQAGANTAWVPSPTAAILHVTHYHQIDVFSRQNVIKARTQASLDSILTIPLADNPKWSEFEIQQELDNNAQGILGYVVRWIDQGIGCSKVLDINNIGLMEDRATLRISSQHIANWLRHGICNENQVKKTMERMAVVVDQQNAGDISYKNMAPDLENSTAFQAACDLVFLGAKQPNGYTEPLLHARRRELKELTS